MKKIMMFVVVLSMLFSVCAPALAETDVDVSAIDLTSILEAALLLIAAIITRYVIPWIKERTDDVQQQRIQAAINTAVFAAEQLFGAGHGEEKKEYALELLAEKGFNVESKVIDAGIEAVVASLNLVKDKGKEE